MPTTWPAPLADDIRSSIAHFSNAEGSVLLALQLVQDRFGYVPDIALDEVAQTCNVSRAEVYGVFTYYSDLRPIPPARNVLKICIAEACQASGSTALTDAIKSELGLDIQEKTRTDNAEVLPVYCLGNCALGPAALVNDQLIGRTTVSKIRTAMNGEA